MDDDFLHLGKLPIVMGYPNVHREIEKSLNKMWENPEIISLVKKFKPIKHTHQNILA